MEKNLTFYRKLPIPQDIKSEFPISKELAELRQKRLDEMSDIFTGTSDKLILVIGPCSADAEAPVLEYVHRLGRLQEEVRDKLMLVPRIYTSAQLPMPSESESYSSADTPKSLASAGGKSSPS